MFISPQLTRYCRIALPSVCTNLYLQPQWINTSSLRFLPILGVIRFKKWQLAWCEMMLHCFNLIVSTYVYWPFMLSHASIMFIFFVHFSIGILFSHWFCNWDFYRHNGWFQHILRSNAEKWSDHFAWFPQR